MKNDPGGGKTTAPDLLGGRVVNGPFDGTNNVWVNEIQGVLVHDGPAERQTYYLSHECRQENLPFHGADQDSATIFQTHRPHEYLTFSCGERFFQIPSWDAPLDLRRIQDIPRIEGNGFFFYPPVFRNDWQSQVTCEERPIRLHDFAETFGMLENNRVEIRKFFFRFAWTAGGDAWTIYAPCRYINFCTTPVKDKPFIQVITGYVLMPLWGTQFHGYFCAAIDAAGRMRSEFLLPRYVPTFTHLAERAGSPEEGAIFGKLAKTFPIYARHFDFVVGIDGQLDFFTYREK